MRWQPAAYKVASSCSLPVASLIRRSLVQKHYKNRAVLRKRPRNLGIQQPDAIPQQGDFRAENSICTI